MKYIKIYESFKTYSEISVDDYLILLRGTSIPNNSKSRKFTLKEYNFIQEFISKYNTMDDNYSINIQRNVSSQYRTPIIIVHRNGESDVML